MINYKRHTLNNGLRVILHKDTATPMAVVNLLYNVGTKNEDPSMTGFAHLFEHLMFSGTKDVPNYDTEIELAAGENNAFTNVDITNYFDILPAVNIETAIWLEADRMQNLNINHDSLEIQKKVVVEEFYETCLNLPYGDAWHHIIKMAYGDHPYSWPTIGIEPSHIKNAKLKDVQHFFDQFYNPNNAILVIAGNIDETACLAKVEKWFSKIPNKNQKIEEIPKAHIKSTFRTEFLSKKVPSDVIYMAYGMCDRLDKNYYVIDLLSDVLASGKSSRFYQKFVKDEMIFSHIDAYITGVNGEGLFVIDAQLMPGMDLKTAQLRIKEELLLVQNELIEESELRKIQNKVESNLVFSDLSISNKAYNLAYFESIGCLDMINKEKDYYAAVTREDIKRVAQELFIPENNIVLNYQSENG